MSYQALSRKWRPKTFLDVIGQEHVILELKNSFFFHKIHHAYLLSGSYGTGKTTIARLIAKGLNCENGTTFYPCCKCNNCIEIEKGFFVDLIEIDAASRTKVEETKEVLNNIQYMPTKGRFKIYLIDEVHMLSRYSFNALLKTLEEPPEHIKFLLATTNPNKLPKTVISRCLQFNLNIISTKKIFDRLSFIIKKENIEIEKNALEILSQESKGSMRDALNLVDQISMMKEKGKIGTSLLNKTFGFIENNKLLNIIESIVTHNEKRIIEELENFSIFETNWEKFLIKIIEFFYKITIFKLFPEKLYKEEKEKIIIFLKKISSCISLSSIQSYYRIILEGKSELSYAPNKKMGIEMILFRAINHEKNRKNPSNILIK